MTSAITVQISDTHGFDSRLLFPGSNVSVLRSATISSSSTVLDQDYTASGEDFHAHMTGSGFKFGYPASSDIAGEVNSATYSQTGSDGNPVTVATLTVSLDSNASEDFSGDPMQSFIGFTPNSSLEILAEIGDVQLNLLGNVGNDKLYGSDYHDFIDGGAGNDVLTGDRGADTFFFEAAGKKTADHVTDFTHLEDTIEINSAALKGISTKHLDTEFHDITKGGMKSEDADDRLLYDRDTGNLYYDKDGNKAHGETPQLIATFDNHAHLDIRDIEIFG